MKRDERSQPEVSGAAEPTAVAEAADKRSHPRIPVCVGVEIVDPTTGVRITGRATDFGVGGCYVDTMNTFAEGTPVEVLLDWQGRRLTLRALVSYSVNGRSIGMGLAFIGVPPETGATLLGWITGLNQESPQAYPPRIRPLAAKGRYEKSNQPARVEDVIDFLVKILVRRRTLTPEEGAQLGEALAALRATNAQQ